MHGLSQSAAWRNVDKSFGIVPCCVRSQLTTRSHLVEHTTTGLPGRSSANLRSLCQSCVSAGFRVKSCAELRVAQFEQLPKLGLTIGGYLPHAAKALFEHANVRI